MRPKRPIKLVLRLTPAQAEALGWIATGGALAHERSRTERTLWHRICLALQAAERAAGSW